MTDLPTQLASVLVPYRDRARWVVSLSGGLDSTVLLHALATLANEHSDNPPLQALHIHHGLQAEADQWERHCTVLCGSLSVPIHVEQVSVTAGEGPEAAARHARYSAFERFLQPGDVLLQAHHRDDQVETLLMRLLRGTGIDGAAGIPASRPLGPALLLRPLLDVTRAQLHDYATRAGLDWIEDPSNADTALDRNYLRHTVLPLVESRWPAYRDVLSRFAGQAGAISDFLSEQLPQDMEEATRYSAYTTLDCGKLLELGDVLRKHALQQWLARQTGQRLSEARLDVLCREVVKAAEDAEPCLTLGGLEVRRFRGRLYLVHLPDFDVGAALAWNPNHPLDLPGGGRLSAEPAEDKYGLHLDRGEIRFRAGGERCRPGGRAHSQTLKKLLQEYDVPPWLRDRLPLIYSENGELAAAADLWVCEGFTGPGGLRLRWKP